MKKLAMAGSGEEAGSASGSGEQAGEEAGDGRSDQG